VPFCCCCCCFVGAAICEIEKCDPHESSTATGAVSGGAVGAVGAGALPLLGAVANKKKCTNVKSTLIAKKTKFLKILEEEKWRSSNNIHTEDADAACGAPSASAPAAR